jgi:tetratricopeptide (TPR) repeat protein
VNLSYLLSRARPFTTRLGLQAAATFVLLASLLATGASAQILSEIWHNPLRLDDLVNAGKYPEAIELARIAIKTSEARQQDGQKAIFLTYLGKADVELGRLGEASQILASAEALKSPVWDNDYPAALLREKAALLYALAEYDEAAITAERAHRLSLAHNLTPIRAEYCSSIRALALLRMGKVRDAEKLALTAVKALPGKDVNNPVYGPRILYTACLVEGHLGKSADAMAFCRRGSELASKSKGETLDLSLGHLALAEAYLLAGDLTHSRESALESTHLTVRLFGPQHQDMIGALVLLAQLSIREGNAAEACAHASEAATIAKALFGEGAPGSVGPARVLLESC